MVNILILIKKINIIIVFLYVITAYSCVSKKSTTIDVLKNKEIEISNIYKKFMDNKHDYGEKARDTILNRFKETLLKTLADKEYAYFPFDSLSNSIKIISSKDKKLRIFSWDEFNGGTWHVYNSAYQYNASGKSYSGILSLEGDRLNSEPLYTDIFHFKVEKLKRHMYLVKGYGTHGSGYDFYVFRLLNIKNNIVTDCEKCFDGKDRFIFNKPRSADISPIYNSKTQEILYPEMVVSYLEGEDTGFTKQNGEILKLKYKNGKFIKL